MFGGILDDLIACATSTGSASMVRPAAIRIPAYASELSSPSPPPPLLSLGGGGRSEEEADISPFALDPSHDPAPPAFPTFPTFPTWRTTEDRSGPFLDEKDAGPHVDDDDNPPGTTGVPHREEENAEHCIVPVVAVFA